MSASCVPRAMDRGGCPYSRIVAIRLTISGATEASSSDGFSSPPTSLNHGNGNLTTLPGVSLAPSRTHAICSSRVPGMTGRSARSVLTLVYSSVILLKSTISSMGSYPLVLVVAVYSQPPTRAGAPGSCCRRS